MMKLVYMGDSKSPAERRAGSSPAAGTTFYDPNQIGWGFFMPKICVGARSRPLRLALISVLVRPLGKSEPKRSSAVTRSELMD